MGIMGTLPMELITEILARLPVKTLLLLKSVCKSWKNLISTTTFTNLHLEHSSTIHPNRFAIVETTRCSATGAHHLYLIDMDTPNSSAIKLPSLIPFSLSRPKKRLYHAITSCKGLVCLCSERWYHPLIISILNPLTGSLLQFQGPETKFDDVGFGVGFGYDHMASDYKVVLIGTVNGNRTSRVMIYSLKAKSWRSIDDDTHGDLRKYSFDLAGGLINNHLLYWRLYSRKSDKYEIEIACLDLCNEKWNVISGPYQSYPSKHVRDLKVYNGCLCVCLFSQDCLSYIPTFVWLLKYNYNGSYYWIRLGSAISNSLFYPHLTCKTIPYEDGSELVQKLRGRGITELGKYCELCNNRHIWFVEVFRGSLVSTEDCSFNKLS